LDGIPPAPRGVPQIEVTFDIDVDGILNVSATDKATGRSQHIRITASSGLTEDEVEKMRREAESHAEEDRMKREFVEARNEADNAVYSAEKVLREGSDKLPEEKRSQVEEKVQVVRRATEAGHTGPLKDATGDLLRTIREIGVVETPGTGQVGGGAPGGANPGQAAPAGDVIDGEFKES